MMFLGLQGARHGLNHKAVGKWGYRYADSFQQRFGSLNCRCCAAAPSHRRTSPMPAKASRWTASAMPTPLCRPCCGNMHRTPSPH